MKNFRDYKQWENSGWDKMSSILDQNMPQKKKRRFLLYLPLWGVGAILIFAFIARSHFHKNTNDNEQLSTQTLNELSNNAITKVLDKCEPLPLKNILNHIKLNDPLNQKVNSIKAKTININHNYEAKVTVKNTIFEKTFATSPLDKSYESLVLNRNRNQLGSIIDSSQELESNLVPMMTSLLCPVIQQNNTLNSIQYNFDPIIISKKAKPLSKSIDLGIETGIQYYPSSKSPSYIAGLFIDFKLKNKWSLVLSPSIEMRKGTFLLLDSNETSLIVTNLDSFQRTTDLFTKSEFEIKDAPNGKTGTPVIKQNSLYNLQIPLALSYHINNRWAASIGLKLSIPLQKDILASDKNYILQWENNHTSLWKVEPIKYFLQGGVQFYPISSIEILLDYSMELSKLNKIENETLNSSTLPTNFVPSTISLNSLNHFSASLKYRF